MKKSINRIISAVLSVCVLITMASASFVANAATAQTAVELVVSSTATSNIETDGAFNLVVGITDYDSAIYENKVLGATIINVTYDETLVTPDVDAFETFTSISEVADVTAKDGVITFVFTGDLDKYVTKAQLDGTNGELLSIPFTANGVDGEASFGVSAGSDMSSTSLAVLDLDVVNGADGELVTDLKVEGIGNFCNVTIGEGETYVYEPKAITVTMVDANGTNGYWYAPNFEGPFFVGDNLTFNTAYQKINIGGTTGYEPWSATFSLEGGTGSGNSAGNLQLYVGANGGVFNLDKAGTWSLTCYVDSVKYTLMSIKVYPTPSQAIFNQAAEFDALVEQLPLAEDVELADEAQILAAFEAYEVLNETSKLYVTTYDKYIATYESFLTLKYGSVGRAMAYEVIEVIEALPEPYEIALTDADAISYARTKYTQLKDEYKEYVDNYKKLVACESALDAIYIEKTVTYWPDKTDGSGNYVAFSGTEIYVSDSLRNNAWWQNYTFKYVEGGTTYSGKIYNAEYRCPSANITRSVQVGFGKSTGSSESAYKLTAAGEWYLYGTIEDNTNGWKTIELAHFTVLPTPYGNADNAAADAVNEGIANLPSKITSADVDTVKQLKADYDALVRYDLVSPANVEKLMAAYELTENITNLTMDLNGDLVLDSADLVLMEMMIVGLDTPVEGADINRDGTINALDLLMLEQHYLGYSLLF